MKVSEIVNVLAQEFGTKDVAELNKLLKAKNAPSTKYKLSGKKLGHLGYTALIKNIAADGVKIYNVNKVTLIKFSDIEKFEKAKPRVPRFERPKTEEPKKQIVKKEKEILEDDEAPLDVYGNPLKLEKFRPKKPVGKSGSSFIPVAKKKPKK